MAKGKYQEWLTRDGLLQIEGWARRGLTNEQIAKNIGVSRKTFQAWLNIHSDICDALKRGRRPLNVELENALIKKALGYTDIESVVTEEKIVKGKKMTTTKTVKKTYPSDTGALIFILKNRLPQYYSDRPKTEDEKQKIELENEISRLKIQLLENEIQSENPEISKVDDLINRLDYEAETGAEDAQ